MIPSLYLENVSAGHLAETVLRDVSLAVDPGERVGIAGPNGAGKTTLLCAAAGLARLRAGRVCLGGEVLTRRNAHLLCRRIGYVPQHFEVDSRFPISGREVMFSACPGRAGARGQECRAARAADLAARLGLGDLLDRPFGQLSGGEKKRLLVARALLPEPDFLFLDEIFAWLDRRCCHEMAGLLAELCQQRQLTMLLVSHDPLVLTRLCRRVIGLEGGAIVFDGTAAAFRRRCEDDV